MKTIKKRHHYLPEFYLRGFANPPSSCLWMYQKNCESVKPILPHDAAVKTFYYSFKNEIGELDSDTIENMMADIEGISAPIFKKIENKEKLTEDERRTFSLFLAFIRIRVPNFRENIENSGAEVIKMTMKDFASNEERFRLILEDYKKSTGKEITIPVDRLRNFALNDSGYKVKLEPIFSLFVGVNMAIKLSDIINEMKWDFRLSTKDNAFITSDNPLAIYDPYDDSGVQAGLLLKKTILTFPITRNISLYAYWSNDRYIEYKHARNNEVKKINRMTVINSRRFVYAPDKLIGIKSLVRKYSNYVPKIEVIHNPPYIQITHRLY